MSRRTLVELVIRLPGENPGTYDLTASLGSFALTSADIDWLERALREREKRRGRGRPRGAIDKNELVEQIGIVREDLMKIMNVRRRRRQPLAAVVCTMLPTADVNREVRDLRDKRPSDQAIYLIARKRKLPESRVRLIVRALSGAKT